MAAIGCHVALIVSKKINPIGGILPDNATIGMVANSSSEFRVKYDSTIPNTANYPTIEDYIKLEAQSGYKVQIINQTHIITYNS